MSVTPPGSLRRKVIVCFFAIVMTAGSETDVEYNDISIPLNYGYTPGPAGWARRGDVDARTFTVRVPYVKADKIGVVYSEDGSSAKTSTIRPEGNSLTRYFKKAVPAILKHNGFILDNPASHIIYVIPKKLMVSSSGNEKDGEKVCYIELRVELFGSDSSSLVHAAVSNRGHAVFDDDDAGDYADLVDRTLYGAMMKVVGSRILFTDKQLGPGTIVEREIGLYSFVPKAAVSADSGIAQDSLQKEGMEVREPYGSGVGMLGTDIEADVIKVEEGKKIPVGILPFENATGRQGLSDITRGLQDNMLTILGSSRTVKVIEREKLAEILREQALGMSGIMNDSTVVKVGNISGVKAMVACRVTESGGYYAIHGRVFNVETGMVVAAAQVYAPDANQITALMPELTAKLLMAFTAEKIEVNRNTMVYPSPCPISMPAIASASEDAWAIETNPACLMKVKQRDAQFYFSGNKTVSGRISSADAPAVTEAQPLYENMGTNLVIPIGTFFASGFGIKYDYPYPKVAHGGYMFKEEGTTFSVPLAVGITPAVSAGVTVRTSLREYQIHIPSVSREGHFIAGGAVLGALVKISPKFKAGLTFIPKQFYQNGTENFSINGVDATTKVSRSSPNDFRFGVSMYPLDWFFFFGDIRYRKFDNEPAQPGLYLGGQLTKYGRPFHWAVFPKYGITSLFLGYAHEPYDRVAASQAKYFCMGIGYCVNNIYATWSLRTSVGSGGPERTLPVGDMKDNVRLYDYSSVTSLFLCIGYRF